MLRTSATRPLFKSLVRTTQPRISIRAAVAQSSLTFHIRQLSNKRPQALVVFRPAATSIALYATKTGPPYDNINPNEERKVLERKLEAHPEAVSGDSSVRHVFEHSQNTKVSEDADMLAGIRSDLVTIKETFQLNDVPRDTLYLGAAGALPYLGTSLSTVYLAYDISHAKATGGAGYLFTDETARQLLDIVTPIQIGYGAVIISFLGAIHWGLEYAGYGGKHSYSRYAIGVAAPAIAWPTMLMPVEYALITQFLAFNALYFTDARATVRGWCPPWYSTYRFVLTFIVGASIVISLIGRGQIQIHSHHLPGPAAGMQALRDSQWENLEKEERERRKALAAQEEEDEDSEEEESDGDDEKEGGTAGTETDDAGDDGDEETHKKEAAKQEAQNSKLDNAKESAGSDEPQVKGRGKIASSGGD